MSNRALASSFVAALVGVLLTVALPREAAAALIPIESLESLAFGASTVVYATRLSTADAGPYAVASTYRVEKAYTGELHAGDTFVVDDWFYPASDPFGTVKAPDEGKRVFFLEHRGAEAPGWSIVTTGARIVAAAGVYRFFQYSNPGGLAPTPETDGRSPGPITFAAFERKLATALRRAERGHAVLARRAEGAAFRRACLELLGPPVLPRDAHPDGDSEMAREMLRALAEDKDVEGALEVLARTPDTFVSAFPLSGLPDALPRAIAIALDRARPVALRVAVIEGLQSFTTFDERYDVTSLVPLLADPVPDVRVAAVHAISNQAGYSPPRKGQPQKSRTILLDDYKREKDPWVKLALVKTFDWLTPSEAVLRPRDPLLAARQAGDGRLDLEYFAVWKTGILPPDVRYAATDARGARHEGTLEDQGFSYGTTTGEARLDVPLEPGVYKLTITAAFDFEGTKIERSAQVDAFTVAPPEPASLPADEVAEPAPSARAEPPAANPLDAETVRPPRGCGGCSAANPEVALAVFLAPAVVLAFLLRRRRPKTP